MIRGPDRRGPGPGVQMLDSRSLEEEEQSTTVFLPQASEEIHGEAPFPPEAPWMSPINRRQRSPSRELMRAGRRGDGGDVSVPLSHQRSPPPFPTKVQQRGATSPILSVDLSGPPLCSERSSMTEHYSFSFSSHHSSCLNDDMNPQLPLGGRAINWIS